MTHADMCPRPHPVKDYSSPIAQQLASPGAQHYYCRPVFFQCLLTTMFHYKIILEQNCEGVVVNTIMAWDYPGVKVQ